MKYPSFSTLSEKQLKENLELVLNYISYLRGVSNEIEYPGTSSRQEEETSTTYVLTAICCIL